MRLKLVLLTSVVGAVIGTGVSIGIIFAVLGTRMKVFDHAVATRGWTGLLVHLFPLFIAAAAGFFVYRHTARRRKLQAALTVVLVVLFCFIVFVALSFGLIRF